jgi:hypothetical protein
VNAPHNLDVPEEGDIMLIQYFKSPSRIEELHNGQGGHLLEGFAQTLCQSRYQWVAARKHIRAAEHFIHWMGHRGLSIAAIEERFAGEFLSHLIRCRCQGHRSPVKPERQKYSVGLFFHYLRHGGIATAPTSRVRVPESPLLVLFCDWMRRQRGVPLWKETASAVRAWLSVRGEVLAPELFLNARDGCMTRAGFEYILRKHVRSAEKRCASLSSKRVSPHVLRHTCAMTILQATKDLRKVSLWLGHSSVQTTEVYTRADPTVKLETLEAAIAPRLRTGRFKATDTLIALLKAPTIMRSKGAIP